MIEYVLPILYATFVWWSSTVLIIYLDGLPRHTFRWSMLGATALLILSLYWLKVSSSDTSLTGLYIAFTSGLFAWGWQEISFYMGYVTGPRKQPCPEGCSGFAHFRHAVEVSLYHELAIIAAAAAVFALTRNGPNQLGAWTFLVLWWMHQSAKINVFLGVRNINEEYIPDHLEFLKRFLSKKPLNLAFPVFVTATTVITAWLVQKAAAASANPFEASGYTFLATLMALALLEHWLLVLPVPTRALWGWGLASRSKARPFDVDIATGFLGAGKTTFLRRLLADADPNVRTIALVNDFSELGVDASLLRGRGADVVELPNGCICCSLSKDLAAQLKGVVARWAPQRVLIEPSGVADIASLLGVLHQSDLEPLVKNLRVYTVIDAGAFLRDFGRFPDYFETQAKLAPVFIVNKIDLASPAEVQAVRDTLRSMNPRAPIVTANFGHLSELDGLSMTAAWRPAAHEGDEEAHPKRRQHARHYHDHHNALGLKSWSMRLVRPCDLQKLGDVLGDVARGVYGEVNRLKGIARTTAGWVHFDVAGGRSSIAAFAPNTDEHPRVIAIGRLIYEAGLEAAMESALVNQTEGNEAASLEQTGAATLQ
jgi:putative photosynthetic complex assembly protein 2